MKDNNPAGRRGILNIRCGSGASNFPIEAVHFTQASTHEPNEPYVYVLDTTSPLVCGGIGAGMIQIL